MDRNAYLNEDFGSSNDYQQEKDHFNYFNNEEVDPDEELEEMQENDMGAYNEKINIRNQEEERRYSNNMETPMNLQHLSAPKFAPISKYGAPAKEDEYSEEEDPREEEVEEENEALESYSKNNQFSPRNYEEFEQNDHSKSKMSFQSRLLDTRSNRKKVEADVQALANRVALLENEEKKLLGKIEDTKRKALEVMHIKKNAKVHQEILSEKAQRENITPHLW